MHNLYLVQVVDAYGPNKFLPLAISYQWLFSKQDPVIDQTWAVRDVLIEKLPVSSYLDTWIHDPHVVAMSSYVWNWNYNNHLAKEIKKRWPDCIIVVGGPEVNKRDPNLIRDRPWLDVAILGENETAFAELLRGIDPESLTQLPGVITRFTQNIQQPARTDEINDVPSPILSGFYDWIMDRYHERYGVPDYWQVTWETMRGCPYHCSFCDIGDDYWNKTKWFDLDRIYREIDWMADRRIEYLGVCDSNWGIHPRDLDITRYIVETKLRTGYPRILDVTWAKNNPDRVKQIVQIDHEAGTGLIRGLNFSLQSLDSTTLVTNSRFNLRDSVLQDSLVYFAEQHIPTFTELIWPLPGESVTSLKRGLQNLIDLGQKDFLSIHPLVVTNNSPMGQPDFREKNALQTRRVPVDTFWMKVPEQDYVVEQVDAVIATNTVDYQGMLAGNMLGHWLIVLYYYGWAHHAIKYVRASLDIKELDFVSEWIQYFGQQTNSLIGQEHHATVSAYRRVFEQGSFWGRQVDHPMDDIYWEYKSATAVVLHRNRQEFAICLGDFLRDTYGLVDQDLVRLNLDLCVDPSRQYPFVQTYNTELTQTLFGYDSGTLEIDHPQIRSLQGDHKLFAQTAYHFRRKQRYWLCQTKSVSTEFVEKYRDETLACMATAGSMQLTTLENDSVAC